ncbi:MAG: phosphatase PAP2 family protein [Spirochaetaceae bacterium]
MDFTFYAVNLFLAVMNLIVTAAGAGPASRHLPVAAAFILACLLPTLLTLLEDRVGARVRAPWLRRLLRFLRVFYIHAFYGPYFAEVILLSQAVWGGASLDPALVALEEALFGFQPAVAFPAALSHLPAVNELFFFGYFSYYLIITTGFWIMFARGYEAAAERAAFVTITSFAVLYVMYVFVPVHGPKYFFESLNEIWYRDFEGYLFVPFMRAVFDRMNLAGAALPSSHVAISLIALLEIRRHLPRLFRLYAVFFVLLCPATVYIYAHYAVDVVAGLLVVPPLLWIARRIYRRIAAPR